MTTYLIEIKNRATVGEHLSVIISRDRTWTLDEKVDVVFSPYPSYRDQWSAYGIYPPTPFDVDENSRGMIHITNPRINSGQSTSFVANSFGNELFNQGILPDNDRDYKIFGELIFPISSDNTHVVIPLVVGNANSENGGRVTERPNHNSNLITSN